MKKSILLYAFILLALTNLFTYSFLSKEVEFEQKRFQKFDKKMHDTINAMVVKNADSDYFSLENNQNAQEYFENNTSGKAIPTAEIITLVKEKLLDLNSNPNGNPYVGFEKMNDKKFVINKVKLLNHRWIIADFSNGELWGEVILKYFINDDKTVSFETAETLVYPKS